MGLRIAGNLLTYFFHLALPLRLHRKEVEDPLEFELLVDLLKRTAEVGFELGEAPIVAWAHLQALNSVELYRPSPQLGNLYCYHLAVLAGQLRQPKLPGRHWKAGLRALRRTGTPHQRGKAGVWLAMRHFLLGRLEHSARVATRSLADLSEAGDLWEAQIILGLLSNIRFAQGRVGEALELAREAYYGALRWNNALAAARALLAWAQASCGSFPKELLDVELRRAGTSAYRLFELYLAADWPGLPRTPEPPALKARLAVLLETARDLLDAACHEQFLQRAADALRFMTRAERAWVVSGPPQTARAARGGRAPISPEPYALSLKLGRSVRLEDPDSDPALARHGVRSALYVPLGPASAVLLVHSRINSLFGHEDVVLADFLARLTSTALESHQRLAELRDSELRFRTLFESAGVGLQLISLEGRLLAENQFLRDRLGLGSPDSKDPLSLLESPDRAKEAALLAELLAGERESYSLMLRHRRDSGASAWTQVTATLLRTTGGQPARAVRAVSDVSTRHLEWVIDFGESQRQLLALDLHDGIAQRLIAASFQSYVGTPERALEVVRKELSASVEEVRRLHRDLSSPLATRQSYRKALRDFLINLEMNAGLRLDWRIRREPKVRWPRGLSGLFSYRIVQEALSNVLRHSKADRARVRLWLGPNQLRGEVLDNGVGLGSASSSSPGRAHVGLAGIRLRCELLGGRSRVETMPGGGTRLRFVLPREEEA